MRDPNLKAKLVFNGLESPKDVSDLSPVTTFKFLSLHSMIILEKIQVRCSVKSIQY
jgi:hypothetical protein